VYTLNIRDVPDEYLAEKGIKFVMIKNYMMFYTINEDEKTVIVIRFLYGRRDWKNILKV
jgi:plasmid stabilization system protein ParE